MPSLLQRRQHSQSFNRYHRHVLSVVLGFCFLFLSCQVAIAAHQCSFLFTRSDNSALLMQQTMPTLMKKNTLQNSTQSELLCQKHCSPDGELLHLHDHLSVLAPLVSVELTAAITDNNQQSQHSSYFSPPIIGPPTEISLCRFRE